MKNLTNQIPGFLDPGKDLPRNYYAQSQATTSDVTLV